MLFPPFYKYYTATSWGWISGVCVRLEKGYYRGNNEKLFLTKGMEN